MSKGGISFEEIGRAALARFDEIMQKYCPGGSYQGAEYVPRNPTRADSHPGSFKVNRSSGKWMDGATGDSGRDLISLVAYLKSCSQGEAAKELARFLFIDVPEPEPKRDKHDIPKGISRTVAEFKYQNADGSTAYIKKRFEPGWNGERKSFGFYSSVDGKQKKGRGCFPLLYRLPAVIKSDLVIFAEGEKKADVLAAWGLCGTSLDSGAQSKLTPDMLKILYGKQIVILPDNDQPGRSFAQYLAETLHKKAKSIKVVDLPGLSEKGDICDWILSEGNDAARLMQLIDAAPEWQPAGDSGADPKPEEPAKKMKRADAAALLLEMALELPLYVDKGGDPYTMIDNRAIRVESAESYLTYRFHEQTGTPPSAEAMKNVIKVLAAKARRDGEKIILNNRVAAYDGKIMVDLGAGRCAEITPGGVEIVTPPAIFRNFQHQQPHPDPVLDGTGDPWRFLEFINVAASRALVVMVTIIAAFVPGIIHPLLMIHGPARSGKSTFATLLKMLIDPSSIILQLLQDDQMKDLIVTLQQHYVYAPDNVSKLTGKMADFLCQVVTGISVAQRQLFTDTDTIQLDLKNIVILNGIPNALNRADLADRAISLYLERLRDEQLQGETVLHARYAKAVPGILGGCLLVLARAMAIERDLKEFSSPIRLYDFARWGFCIAEAMGGRGKEFLEDVRRDYREQADELAENNLLATVLRECLATHGPVWDSTVQVAYSILSEKTGLDHKDLMRDPTFPHKVQDLRRHLDRLRPVLEEWGIEYRYGRRGVHGQPVTFVQRQPAEPPAETPAADTWDDCDFQEVTA